MGFPNQTPWRQHNFIGEFANSGADVEAIAWLTTVGWTAGAGLLYWDTTNGEFRIRKSSGWDTLETGTPVTPTLAVVLAAGNSAGSYTIDMNSHKITGLSTPSDPTDAVNKSYVDGLIQGIDWQESVLEEESTPPGTPSTGDRYLVIATASGAWTGHEDDIAEYNGSSWDFTSPNDGMAVWIEDEDRLKVYNGSAWVTFGSTVDHTTLSNLNSTNYYHLTQAEYTSVIGHLASTSNPHSTTLDQAYTAGQSIAIDVADLSLTFAGAYSFLINLGGITGDADGFFIEDTSGHSFRITKSNTDGALYWTAEVGAVEFTAVNGFDVLSGKGINLGADNAISLHGEEANLYAERTSTGGPTTVIILASAYGGAAGDDAVVQVIAEASGAGDSYVLLGRTAAGATGADYTYIGYDSGTVQIGRGGYSDAQAVFIYGGSGGLEIDNKNGDVQVTASDAVTVTAGSGLTLKIDVDDTVTHTITISAENANVSGKAYIDIYSDDETKLRSTAGTVIVSAYGDLFLQTSNGDMVLSDQFKAGSTYAGELHLSNSSAEWSLFETNFGEVSILNAINQAYASTGGVSLDAAYNNFGAAAAVVVIDQAQSQTTELIWQLGDGRSMFVRSGAAGNTWEWREARTDGMDVYGIFGVFDLDIGSINVDADSGITLRTTGTGSAAITLASVGSFTLKDEYLTSAIPLSETGETGLAAGFTATSIIGAINELETEAVKVSSNAGNPNSTVTGKIGDLCWDSTNSVMYCKSTATGNTGWVVIG